MRAISSLRTFLCSLFTLVCLIALTERCAKAPLSFEGKPNQPSPQQQEQLQSQQQQQHKQQPQTRASQGYFSRYVNYNKVLDSYKPANYARWAKTVMVVQFDSRNPNNVDPNNKAQGYIWGSFYLWSKYASQHGHQSVFYTRPTCESCDGKPLSPAWCKVAAVLQAWHDFPSVDLFLYTDSDATISDLHMNTSILDIMDDIAFLPEEPRVVVLNQDGPGHWCQISNMLVQDISQFEHCLNSGTFIIRRHPKALKFLLEWWHLTNIPTTNIQLNPFQYDVRQAWPWEQGPLHIAKERNRESIMVVPHPHRPFMNWNRRVKGRELPMMPYCLSHLPAARCFISHYCTDRAEKVELAVRALKYQKEQNDGGGIGQPIPESTTLSPPSSAWYCTEKKPRSLMMEMTSGL